MTSLLRRIASPGSSSVESRFTFNDLLSQMSFNGSTYLLTGGGTPSGDKESIESSFEGYVNGAYKRNGVFFACMAARMQLFSEARFQYRRMVNGRPGDLFGTQDLAILERPWPGGTTGDLLRRAITDVDVAGNFYAARRGSELRRLRPDWVSIILGSRTGSELDTEVVGYLYKPGGPQSDEKPVALLPEEVAHFAPIPDPAAHFRGMSWVTPVLDELMADTSATSHKRSFFENGAKLNYVVTLDKEVVRNVDQFQSWVEKFKQGHESNGAAPNWNAYKTLFLGAGADVKTVGADMQQIDFTSVQHGGELRICAAAGAGLNLIIGLGGPPTYANFAQARRALADVTMRPLWRNFCGSMAPLVNVPPAAELWYDDRDISFLQEDEKDDAEIQQMQAVTIASLVREGFTADSAVSAVMNGDMKMLQHTGLFSVQLQAPGSIEAPSGQNGNGQFTLPASTS